MTQPHSDAQSIRNVLLIMCDQLRADYLSCYAHSLPNNPAHRRIGWMGRALRASLCPVRSLRCITHVYRHGTLRQQPWRHVELRAAVRRA